MPDTVLAILIVIPAFITYFWKSNAALGYFALCVGFVLSTSVIGDLKHLLSETNLSVTSDTLALILIAFPYAVTLMLARKSATRGWKMAVNLLIGLLGGGLLALSIGPIINSNTNFNVLNSSLWNQLSKYQAGIIGAGAFLSLVTIWLGHAPKPRKH